MSSEFLDVTFGRFGIRPRGVLHVGANSGQEVPDYVDRGIHAAVLVEPQDGVFSDLEAAVRATGNDGFVAVQAACWRSDGEVLDFRLASNDGLSSSLLAPTGHRVIHADVSFDRTVAVNTTTVDTLLRSVDPEIVRSVDALVLDVQGAELDVLEGASGILDQILYIWTEVSWGGLYEGDAALEYVVGHMSELGYRMAHLSMTRWTWGNALFLSQDVIGGFAPHQT